MIEKNWRQLEATAVGQVSCSSSFGSGVGLRLAFAVGAGVGKGAAAGGKRSRAVPRNHRVDYFCPFVFFYDELLRGFFKCFKIK